MNSCACVSSLAAQRVLCLLLRLVHTRCWGRKFKRLLESGPVVIESSCRSAAVDALWLKCEWQKREEACWNAAKCASCGWHCWDLVYGGVSMNISGRCRNSKHVIGSTFYLHVLSLYHLKIYHTEISSCYLRNYYLSKSQLHTMFSNLASNLEYNK